MNLMSLIFPARNRAVEGGFKSQPRRADNLKFSPAILPTKLPKRRSKDSFSSDISAISRFRDLKDAKEAREIKGFREAIERDHKPKEKEHIMFEFNPGVEFESGEYQVQLVPLSMFKTKSSAKDRLLSTVHILRNTN